MRQELHARLLLTLAAGDLQTAAALDQQFSAACHAPASTDEQLVDQARMRALLAHAERLGWQQHAALVDAGIDAAQTGGYAALWTALRTVAPRPALAIELPPSVQACLQALRAAGGSLLLVGGAVRDALLGERDSDLDVKVAGLDESQLRAVLATQGVVHATARTFELRLRDGHEIDVNLSRGATPEISAALEADLTINALAYDPATGELFDFFGGLADLQAGVLRHVSAAFGSDLVRALRAVRFAARWGFRLADETAALLRELASDYLQRPAIERATLLPIDRVRGEWLRLAAVGRVPSAGLRALVESGWIALYPELAALEGCPQDPQFHPEGDVLLHTGHAADAAARLCDRAGLSGSARQVQLLAIIAHDLGKSVTTIGTAAAEQQTIAARVRLLGEGQAQAFSAVAELKRSLRQDGVIRSPGHAELGAIVAGRWLARIGCPHALQQAILPLVRTHMRATGVREPTARMVRRLARDLHPARLDQWALLVDADASGRPPLPPVEFAARWLALARDEGVDRGRPQPLLRGADVLALGVAAGPQVGQILRQAEEAQINGEFRDRAGALAWLERYWQARALQP